MTQSEERPPAARGAREDGDPSSVDARMAELLAENPRTTPDLKRELQNQASEESDDLLSRLNALEYLDALVGEIAGDLPQRLGDYRIVGLLGRGGMGTVFEAFQESLERTVALKVLAPSMTSDPRMRKRFRTEARASATLHHQHIVPVYGFGEAGGFLYFAMERVDGVSLDKHIAAARHRAEVPMEPREAARRFAGVADALGHAHRRGILHRDVKPGNILVHPDGSLALADFGLSKVVGEQSMSISQHGGFLGTLHYAAPEQARGRPVAPASDLYSLGVTIYECVTGRLPVSGESTEALLQALLNDTPRPLRQVLPKAPRDLELVLEKLLSKEPDDRYADGEALARDLLRVADDEPVQVRKRSIVVRAWRQVRKHRLLSAVMAVAALLLLTVFVLWQQFIGEERSARISRHENRLAQAVSRAESELGPLGGPDDLLEVLVGDGLPAQTVRSDFLVLLDEAEDILPDDTRARALRDAYLADPVADATDALRQGRGLTALRMLDERIAEAESRSGFVGRDSVTWLTLYRLYFARAVANLSAAVADPEAASQDLLRASFVRPGAFAPALMSAFVQWRPEAGHQALLQVLDGLIAKAPEELRGAAASVVGTLLYTAAAAERSRDANLLWVDIPYGDRRQLFRRASELRGTSWSPGEGGTRWAGSVEASLEEFARRAAVAMADVPALREELSKGRELLDDEIAPGSPLQSWRVVYALLEFADPGSVVSADSRPLPPALQVRGIEQFLELEVPADVLGLLRTSIERTLALAEAAGEPAYRAQARLAEALEDVERALELATRWALRADEPAAFLCLLRCHIARGEVSEASFEGVRAMQRAIDADSVRRKIVAALERAERADPERADLWRREREGFVGDG